MSEPWAPGDLVRLCALQLLGAFVLLLAWAGVAGASRLSHQFAWTSLGVAGFLLGAAGVASWLLAGRRAVGVRLETLLTGSSVTRAGRAGPPPPTLPPGSPPARPAHGLVGVDGGTRYHRPDCVLVRGKDLPRQQLGRHVELGRRACELCDPDGSGDA